MANYFFLKLEKIDGESEDANFKNQIQLKEWSWHANQTPVSTHNGGLAVGKVEPGDFSFSTAYDKATPKFFQSICKGAHIEKGTLSAVKAGDQTKPYFTANFKEIFVTNLSMSGADENPVVSIQFSYSELAMEYSIQDEKGNLKSTGPVTYNRRQNKVT